eukprot:COSAG06_NODE_53658_length_299_cov_0.415000_1_plen_36_part_10
MLTTTRTPHLPAPKTLFFWGGGGGGHFIPKVIILSR